MLFCAACFIFTDSLDQSGCLSMANGLLILFLSLLFLFHLPNIHLAFNFPVRSKVTKSKDKNDKVSATRVKMRTEMKSLAMDWHAEVGDEGGFGQLDVKEDFLGGVCVVQSLGGHDGVGKARHHSAVHCHAVYLHLGRSQTATWTYSVPRSSVYVASTLCLTVL